MAISKRLRHEIFRRDNHTCQSCGAKAPHVKLQPDHVIPVALGGSDDPSNLQTLCEDCNSGKSATPPDAATVAQVKDDALRWSRAMQYASTLMLNDQQSRRKNREHFEACWRRWHWGSAEAPEYAPLPATWGTSVDQIIAAGLPVELLQECIDTAFAYDTVKRENKFKYACGVAWRKIDKLHAIADRHTGEPVAGAVAATSADRSERNALVVKLLDRLTVGERVRNEIDPVLVYEGVPDEDGDDPIVGAIDAVLSDLRSDLLRLEDLTLDVLLELPHCVGDQAMKILRYELYDVDFEQEDVADLLGRSTFVRRSTVMALHLLKVQAASAYLDPLPAEERKEWMEYAHVLHRTKADNAWWFGHLTPDRAIIRAANAAEVITSGQGWWSRMCQHRGRHIQACPRPGEFRVVFDNANCCGPSNLQEHAGHPYCSDHTELLVAEGLRTDGEILVVRDFTEMNPEPVEEPPF